ncbi:MAG: dephospho-CoA kinase [Chloroflexi bacterium]|nr:dephospho-CoA kinase [Chloroflexota bacterium]
MKIIGITGQIGTGKSSVAKLLATYGVRVLSADSIARGLLEPETEAYYEVIDFFGQEILCENGEVDRNKLASIVFADERKLALLNEIIHPRVIEEMRDRLRYVEEADEGVSVVALDIPILFGSGAESLVSKVIAVVADDAVRVERLRAIGFTESDITARSAAQLPQAELEKRADYVIENSGTYAELRAQVGRLWRTLEEDD